MGPTERIADWVAKVSFKTLEDAAVETVQRSFVDTIGCMLIGVKERSARLVAGLITTRPDLPASLVGLSGRASAVDAALSNGVAAHALDYDDYDLISYAHPGVVLVPTLLAVGQEIGAAGSDVIGAFVAGYQVMQCIGSIMCPPHYEVGFHGTGTIGTIGAAVAAAKLRGLSPDQIRVTLGVSASLAAGLRANFGTDVKPLHAGRAASTGVLAATLAESGYESARQIIETDFGIVDTLAPGRGTFIEPAVERLVQGEISIVKNPPTIKAFPSCGATHSAIDATLRIRRESPIESARDVDEVTVEGCRLAENLLIHHRPINALEAKFSMEGCVALALADGKLGMAQFEDGAIRRNDVQELIGKVRFVGDDGLEDEHLRSASLPARVEVRAGGESRRCDVPDAPGSLRNRLTEEAVMAKFEDCAGVMLSTREIDELTDLLRHLTDLEDVALLADHLGGSGVTSVTRA